jgi:MprA protease rhombosortase-interaction domain-containing protein
MQWQGVVAIVSGVLVLVAGLLYFALRQRRGLSILTSEDRSLDADRKRAEESTKIREDIKKETDQQLADRFNRLADRQESKKD